MAFPILTITNETPLTLSVSTQENRVMEKNFFCGAIQSNNAVFVSFSHIKFCCSGDSAFNYFVCKP